ncbi:MAG: SBBP repeat-containing protein [Deltaproteobacteria bacterium]|nr:SBBP repeat-containing protein [Deltaproteobacteria bacterium]
MSPTFAWAKGFDNTVQLWSYGVALDGSGNCYFTGAFGNTLDFGGGPLESPYSKKSVFLASYEPSGAFRFAKHFPSTTSLTRGKAVALDHDDNIYLSGGYAYEINFGGEDLMGGGETDVYLARFAQDGTHHFSKTFSSGGFAWGNSLAFDSHGNVYVAGSFAGSADFGGGSLSSHGYSVTLGALSDIFVASYDSTGAFRFAKGFGGLGSEQANALALDGNDNVYVVGTFEQSVDFGGGELVSAGGTDIFLASFTSDGVHRFSKRFGNSESDEGHALAVSGRGHVTIGGSFSNSVDFGGGPLVMSSWNVGFLASYDATGAHRFSLPLGDPPTGSWVTVRSIVADRADNLYITGSFNSALALGGGLVSAGGDDIFVAGFSSDGTYGFSKGFGSLGDDEGLGIAVDDSGNLYVTGNIDRDVDFGSGLVPGGIFFLKLAP